jgi:TolB-like protein
VVAAAVLVAGLVALLVSWPPPKPPPDADSVRATTPEAAPLTSIAVFPFDDMSPGGDQRWLGDGMAEELIEALSRIEALRVIARTSAFARRGADIRTLGEQLRVGAVVEGSVRRSNDQIRLTTQLIRVADQSHLWSATYERGLDDVQLGVSETRSWLVASRYATPDVRAWELVQKAVEREETLTEQGFRDEIVLTGQALEIDPKYAQAHAQLGWGYYYLWEFGSDPRDETLARAVTAAERALELEPTNGSAQNLLADISIVFNDYAAAEARATRAMEAAPRHAPLHARYGQILYLRGRVDEVLPYVQRAVALDPELTSNRGQLGLILLAKGKQSRSPQLVPARTAAV